MAIWGYDLRAMGYGEYQRIKGLALEALDWEEGR
jgi:hypothetical protein